MDAKDTTNVVNPTVPAVRHVPSLSLRGLQAQIKQAEILIESGLLPAHIKKAAAAVAIMQRGYELGLPPMEALTSLYVVHGKVSCDSKTMLALAWKSGVLERLTVKESENDHCTIIVKRRGGIDQEFTFRIGDAAALGLADREQYKKQPRVMLRWRAIAEALRVVCPDALAGLYTHEEMQLPVRVIGDDVELDSERVAITERREELTGELGAVFDASAEAGAATVEDIPGETSPSQVTAPSAEPPHSVVWVCPKCKGPMWDNRVKRAEDEAAIAAGTRTKKPRAAWSCKDKACGGAIWPAKLEAESGAAIGEEPSGATAPTTDSSQPTAPDLPISENQKATIKDLCRQFGWKMGPLMELCDKLKLPRDIKKLTDTEATTLCNALLGVAKETAFAPFDRAAAITEIGKYHAETPDLTSFDEALERLGKDREGWFADETGDGVIQKILAFVRAQKAAKV